MANVIGENVKKYRRKCGYTPRRLADLTEIDLIIYRGIESGDVIPEPETMQKLADALREPVHRLYGLPELRTPTQIATHFETMPDGEEITIRFAGKRELVMMECTEDGVKLKVREVTACED